jgi:hypothetical protein
MTYPGTGTSTAAGAREAPVLFDPSGRRRLVVRWVGTLVTGLFLMWLLALALAGVGIAPLGGLPLMDSIAGVGNPPALSKSETNQVAAAGRAARARGAVAPSTQVVSSGASPATAGAGGGTQPTPTRRPRSATQPTRTVAPSTSTQPSSNVVSTPTTATGTGKATAPGQVKDPTSTTSPRATGRGSTMSSGATTDHTPPGNGNGLTRTTTP